MEKYLPVNNIKNLYLPALNIIGLNLLFIYFSQVLNNAVSGGLFVCGGIIIFLALFSPSTFKNLSKAMILLKSVYIGFIVSELPVSILVFLISAVSIEIIVILSLSLELEEACYYNPDYRILSNPIKNQKAYLTVEDGRSLMISILAVSENYMTFSSNEFLARQLNEGMLDCILSLKGKKYSYRGKLFWKKNNYFCFELSNASDHKDNHWRLIYDKITDLKVL